MARSAMYGDWRLRPVRMDHKQLSVKVPPASKGKDCATGGRLATKAETKVL